MNGALLAWRAFDVSQLGWNEFFVSAVFFVLDAALVYFLVPIVVRRLERARWAPARAKIAERTALHLDRQNKLFYGFWDDTTFWTDVLAPPTSALVIAECDRLDEYFTRQRDHLRELLRIESERFLQEVDLLIPEFNSAQAIHAVELYESDVAMRDMALEFLHRFAVEELNLRKAVTWRRFATWPDAETQRIFDGAGKALIDDLWILCRAYEALEGKLQSICELAGLKSSLSGGRHSEDWVTYYGHVPTGITIAKRDNKLSILDFDHISADRFYPIFPAAPESLFKCCKDIEESKNRFRFLFP